MNTCVSLLYIIKFEWFIYKIKIEFLIELKFKNLKKHVRYIVVHCSVIIENKSDTYTFFFQIIK